MRNLLFFVTLCLGLAAAAPAYADANAISCGSNWTAAVCAQAKHKAHGAPVPYPKAMVCTRIVQDGIHKISVSFFDVQGHELDAKDPLHIFDATADSVHCTGRHWWQKVQALGGWVYICNDWVPGALPAPWHGHTTIHAHTPAMDYLLKYGRMPKTGFACLKGAACKDLDRIYGKI